MTLSRFALPLALTVAIAATALTGCAPVLIVGAAAGTALVVSDRRSTGAQVDDTSIETKIAANTTASYGERVHMNVTSYNGLVLLTGEAPDAATRKAIEAFAKSVDRVKRVQNEMVIAPNVPFSSSTNDTYITSKVKTRFIEANRFPATLVKVVTERQVVYLMGIVSRQEADQASEIAANTTDVVRVVRVFEYNN